MRKSGRPRLIPLAISLLTLVPGGSVTRAAAQSFSASHARVPASAGAGVAGAATSARTSPAPLSASALTLAPLTPLTPLAASAPTFSPAFIVPAAVVAAAPAAALPSVVTAASASAPRPAPAAAKEGAPAENATASAPGKAAASESAEAAASGSSSLFDGSVAISRHGAEPVRAAPAELDGPRRSGLVRFDWRLLLRAPQILRESYTKPNRQDYVYLATKTFGLNLAVRAGFAAAAVMKGDLTLLRAALSTGWYQGQDSLFTVFGQTYMKFLGRMTGMLQIGSAKVGDLAFIYLQLCGLEFLNRLVLGPIGMNPLVYSWDGLSLIFVNILQGMLSGGPLVPAINKMRAAGVISESVSMHLYQLASLTMLFGLAASFGYQHLYTLLTTATMIVSWSAYAFFTFLYNKKKASLERAAKP